MNLGRVERSYESDLDWTVSVTKRTLSVFGNCMVAGNITGMSRA